ncbi:MAG TPA: stalk domain-containing protein [Syntrophomonadaceae bacterium]|nr:stalk domain-containing protein [Syntrophomonadaceae bacterium]
MILLTGCRSNPPERITDIGGISMVSVKEASDLLGLRCEHKGDAIVLSQDNIALEIHYASPHVYKDGYIMYVLESPAVDDQGTVYVPLSFFTDYLGIAIRSDDKKLLKPSL